MNVEFEEAFTEGFGRLPTEIQVKCRERVRDFGICYAKRQFPKSFRLHKCGHFLSVSITMNYRIFVRPIPGGIKFSFVGNHDDADRFLR